jgi:hypothetical protein
MRKDGQNAPRLQSVITEAVERVSNIQPRNTIGAREHPTIRSARSSSDVKRDIRARYAFVNGGQNTITTAPNFYTPFTTPSSFQIPTNRIEEYLWAQWFFDNEPAVAASIEFYTDFPLSGFQLECGNSKVLEFYQQMVKDLDFARLLPLISQEYHLRGDVFVYASLDCEHCGGTGVDQDTHEPCEHLGAKWKSITLLNPTQVELSPSMMDMQPIYYYMPDEGMKKVVQERKPIATYKSIPDAIKAYIMKNEPIPLDPVCIHHFKRGAAPWQPFGRSMVRRLFPTLVYKDKLRQAQYLVAERHILPFKIAKLGNDDRPASEQDLEMIAEEIANVANDPLMTMIAPHTFEMDYVGACHDDATEVLTPSGWKSFEEVNGEVVGCYNHNTQCMEWHAPQAMHKHYYDSQVHGPLIRFSGKHYDSVVTPNHDMWIQKRIWNVEEQRYTQMDWSKVRADQITDHDRFLSSMGWLGTTPRTLPYLQSCAALGGVELDDFLKFVGYYVSEGSLRAQPDCIGGHSSACIYQKTDTGTCNEIESVLRNCFGEKLSSTSVQVGKWHPVTHFVMHNVELARYMEAEFGHGSQNKKLPRWILELPVDKLKIVLDALIAGDGDVRPSGRGIKTRYSTTSNLLADQVQEIATKLGYNAKISYNEKRTEKHHLPIYRVFWAQRTNTRVVRSRNIENIEYQGYVYCLTVPTGLLITRRNGKINVHGNSGKVLQLTNEFELINQDIFDGFMLNKALLNGEGPSYANAQVGLLSMGQRLNKLRGEMAHWIEENLFKPVAEWNGFEVDNKRGGSKLIYPTVKWDDLQLRDNTNLLQIAMQARQAGDLSSQTMLGLMDINYDQEIERLRMENSYSVSTSPMLPAGEMGNGYRGPMGGGMPPMGGGIGMPPAVPGGMPPAVPGGMPPMPTASGNTPEENYREAVSFTNAVHDSVRTSFYNYTREVYANKYKSEAHRHFIESQCPIDGTGFRGALAPELSPLIDPLDDYGQYHGGDESVPMNPLAMQERQSDVSSGWIREARKPSKDEELRPSPYQKFTSWENKLYGIVLSINPPLPFYAQYAAGPDDQYRLDGAFPDIQLGVEADSETYHSTPEYIERDRYRDSQLAAQGWTLLRFTESELKERPDEVQALIMRTIQHLIKRKLGN